MSFRSHSRATTQPLAPRRRSLSSSRTSSTNSLPSSYYNGSSGYSSRPLSTGYYPGSGQSSKYQSPYVNSYGSRDALYNHSSRNSYYPGGAYDRYSKNSYGTDRYVSPYSSFDNGVTTAGLSLSMPGKGYSQKSSTYSNKPNNSKINDYNSGRNTNLLKSKSLSTSNTSVNSYPASKKISVGTNTPTTLVARSQSLRDQERKSRSRSRNRNVAVRSLSASSEKSEGYESGSEKTSRSRLGSTASVADNEQGENKKSKETENGEVIDYKALWEAAKLENEKLKKELKKKDDELVNAKSAVDRITNATSKNSLSELEKREKRAMERKLSEMEEELKLLQKLKTENERLRAENRALTRVVSKLTTSAQNQLHKKQ